MGGKPSTPLDDAPDQPPHGAGAVPSGAGAAPLRSAPCNALHLLLLMLQGLTRPFM